MEPKPPQQSDSNKGSEPEKGHWEDDKPANLIKKFEQDLASGNVIENGTPSSSAPGAQAIPEGELGPKGDAEIVGKGDLTSGSPEAATPPPPSEPPDPLPPQGAQEPNQDWTEIDFKFKEKATQVRDTETEEERSRLETELEELKNQKLGLMPEKREQLDRQKDEADTE